MTAAHIFYAIVAILALLGTITLINWLVDGWYKLERRRHRPRLANLTTMHRPVPQLDAGRRQAIRVVRSPEVIAMDIVSKARRGK